MNWLIFDVETTGFNFKKDFVISIGAVMWDDQNGDTSEFYELLNWTLVSGVKFAIPEESQKVHGITLEMLQTSPNSYHPAKVIAHMHSWIKAFMDGREDRGVHCLSAFNSSFDINMMRSNLQWMCNRYVPEGVPGGGYVEGEVELSTMEIDQINHVLKTFTKSKHVLFIDSLTVDRIFHFEEDGIKVKHNLEDVGLRYGLDVNMHAHNAMYDTRRLADILKKQMEELRERNIALDQAFEERLVRKWQREKDKWRKKNKTEDYYGLEMGPLEV